MPQGLFAASCRCLSLSDPVDKGAAVRELAAAHGDGRVHFDPDYPVRPIGPPGRPAQIRYDFFAVFTVLPSAFLYQTSDFVRPSAMFTRGR